jgi:hypothetical protein
MAVIPDIPGLKVEVIANEEPLKEYDTEVADDAAKTVTKFVEVRANDKFEISTTFDDDFVATHGFLLEVRLDGSKVYSTLLPLGQLKKSGGHKASGVRSKISGRWHMSNFVFSSFVIG